MRGPQPIRITSQRDPVGWAVLFAGRRLPADEFAALHPDIDQTMLADSGSTPFPDTLLRMIECGWRPWMGRNGSWMYPEDSPGSAPPERPSLYPNTSVPGKFLIDAQP